MVSGHLTLNLLGGCQLLLDGQPLHLPFTKSRALLCYLAVTGTAHSRDALTELLWGESSDGDARANLRVRLSGLRRTLPNHLIVHRDSVAFNQDSAYELDVERFRVALRTANDPRAWRAAAGLYQGDFLEGVHVPGALAFETWLMGVRERLRNQMLHALEQLAAHHAGHGDFAQARDDLTHFLTLDPWREDAHRALMRALAQNGQRESAVAQYQTCCCVLHDELGLQPTEETTQLYELIRSGGLGPVTPVVIPTDSLGERRHLTVMSCTLLNGEALVDPEDLQAYLDTFYALCARVVAPFEGVIARQHGSIILGYFGYPLAHEDAARRAVQAGLTLLEQGQISPVPLQVSIGIQTGPVVVTPGRAGTPEVIGLTIAVAQNLHAHRQTAGLWIGGATRHLVQGYFETTALGTQQLDGVAAPLEVYEVRQASGAQARLQARPPRNPLVGRTAELAQLLEWWRTATPGAAQAMLLRGEAGIGKSRLLHTLRERVEADGGHWLEAHCSPVLIQRPFAPVATLLKRVLGLTDQQSCEEQLDRLEAALSRDGLPAESAPLLADVLGIASEHRFPARFMSAERQRQLTFETIIGWFEVQSTLDRPVMVLEDLHWCDPSTLELIGHLLRRGRSGPLLLTARPEFDPVWSHDPALRWMELPPLTPEDTLTLVGNLVEGHEVAPALRRSLARRSDGIPLYTEELTRNVLETGAEQAGNALPPTLQDVLAARLDRLGAARGVAQHAAILGRTFSLEDLASISPWPAPVLQQHLDHLIRARLLTEAPRHYSFRHALIQDAAYDSLLKRARQRLHARVAEVLSGRPQDAQPRPEELARHYAAAGQTGRAIDLWQTAATQALSQSAHQEAIELFLLAVTAFQSLEPPPSGTEQHLTLLSGLRAAYVMAEGYASPEAGAVDTQMLALAQASGASARLFMTHLDRAGRHVIQAQYPAALALLQQLDSFPRTDLTALHFSALRFMTCRVTAAQGQLQVSVVRVNEALQYAQTARQSGLAQLDIGALDLWISASGLLSLLHWLQGHPDQALKTIRAAIQESEQQASLFTRTGILLWALMLYDVCRERQTFEHHLQHFLALTTRQNLRHWLPYAQLWEAERQVRQGNSGGVALAQTALGQLDALGSLTLRPYLLSILARVQRRAGQVDAALETLGLALKQADDVGEHSWEAELHRMRGEILLGKDQQDEAEEALERGLVVARQQQAKSLELRVATSLARLWRQRGRVADAQATLGGVYTTFTEGFDTRDSQEARSLLTSFSAQQI